MGSRTLQASRREPGGLLNSTWKQGRLSRQREEGPHERVSSFLSFLVLKLELRVLFKLHHIPALGTVS